jgi:hypothetical protein
MVRVLWMFLFFFSAVGGGDAALREGGRWCAVYELNFPIRPAHVLLSRCKSIRLSYCLDRGPVYLVYDCVKTVIMFYSKRVINILSTQNDFTFAQLGLM